MTRHTGVLRHADFRYGRPQNARNENSLCPPDAEQSAPTELFEFQCMALPRIAFG